MGHVWYMWSCYERDFKIASTTILYMYMLYSITLYISVGTLCYYSMYVHMYVVYIHDDVLYVHVGWYFLIANNF